MLGYMLTTLGASSGEEWAIRTAGTHVAEGSGMSARTRDALMKIEELGAHRYGAHRSHQVTNDDVSWAQVILASEADHVHFVRREFRADAPKAVQLAQFVRWAPREESLGDQLRVVTRLGPDPALDVGDPAGGDQAAYDRCARELWAFAQDFALLVERGS